MPKRGIAPRMYKYRSFTDFMPTTGFSAKGG